MYLYDYMAKLDAAGAEKLAAELGTTAAALKLLAYGHNPPSLKRARAVEKATGGAVTLYDWEGIRDHVGKAGQERRKAAAA